MAKQNATIKCACGCGGEMTIREDDENIKNTIFSVPNKSDPLRPKFFELDKDGAFEVYKWLESKYKFRNMMLGITSENLTSSDQSNSNDIIKESPVVEQPEKRKRGRPKKTTS